MKHSPARSTALVRLLALFLGAAAPCLAQEFVEPRTVVASPQRFWAKEIAVQDRLIEHPSRDTQRINDRGYFTFRTATLGVCYADPDCVERLRILRLQQDYLFVGTVLERRGKYYIAFKSVDPLIRDPEAVVNLIGKGVTPELERHRLVEQIGRTMDQAEARILVYVRQERVDPKEMFNPDGPHYDVTLRIIADAIVAEEREGRMSATEVLTRAIRDRFANHYLGPNARSLEENIPPEMLKEIDAVVPPGQVATPKPPSAPATPPASSPTIPIQIDKPPPTIAKPEGNKPAPEQAATPVVILGNEPDDVLERMLQDAEKGVSGAPEKPKAPEPSPPVVVVPEPVVPEVVPPPAPEPEPPQPEPPAVVPAEPVVPEVVPPPAPEPEPPQPEPPAVVPPEPVVPEVVPPPAPEPEPAKPEPPIVVVPEPVPPEVEPAPKPAVPPVVIPPEPEPEPVPPVVVKPVPPKPVPTTTKPVPVQPVPKPVPPPAKPEGKPLPPPVAKEPVKPQPPKPDATKPGEKPKEDEEGVYDPDVDFHFKHLKIK